MTGPQRIWKALEKETNLDKKAFMMLTACNYACDELTDIAEVANVAGMPALATLCKERVQDISKECMDTIVEAFKNHRENT